MLAFSLISPTAYAEDGPPPEPAVKTTVFAMPHPGVSDETIVDVLRALESGLKRNTRLEVHDLDSRLADFAQEVPQDQVEAARTAYKEGQKALMDLNVGQAVQRLSDAVAGLAKVLPYIKKQELADAMASLAVAYYENGDKQKGADEFISLLTWRNDYGFDPQKFPPQYIPMFEAAQQTVQAAKRGALEISSAPDGAQAYVDGKYIAVTPCEADGLIVGEHYVTFKKEGYKKQVAVAKVNGKKIQKVAVTLEANEKYLLVQQSMEKIGPTLGTPTPAPEMDDLKQVLFIEFAIFLKTAPKGEGKTEIDAYLYDLRTKRMLTHVTKTVPNAAAANEMTTLSSTLFLNVDYTGALVAPKDKPPPPKLVRPPLYKTWYFWGGTALLAAIIVASAVVIVETRPPVCPVGQSCFMVAE
jgi:hypothetical protein